MQPFINPNYYQPYAQPAMPFQNPYQQSAAAQCTINGRMVDNLESISANDVPMQGYSIFPKTDMSVIYAKTWQPNGTIKTIAYKPYLDDYEADKVNCMPNTIESRFDGLNAEIKALCDKVESISEQIGKMSAKPKKEV